MNERPYQQCTISVLDTCDDPAIEFDDQGRSHYDHEYLAAERDRVFTGAEGELRLAEMVRRIKADGRGKPYDCILGVSGGVDSSYLALLAKQHGLRVLAVHFDNGWNSELAVMNIEGIISRLGFDLHTLVVDWAEFRDLQRAYLKASVVDVEALTDHAIIATMHRLAAKYGVSHIIGGNNVVTEQVLPPHWVFNKTDHRNIKAIHARYGERPLHTYPLMDWRLKTYGRIVHRLTYHAPLNLVPYNKDEVKRVIERELAWRDYGGKHHESIFTRFYQGYILPRKFGIDKRKAHLSNLIFSGQMTRNEALSELKNPHYEPEQAAQDLIFVRKKLGLSHEEFEHIMSSPRREHREFDHERSIFERMPILKPFRGVLRSAKRVLLRG
jgi:N-acetyl sugar amidotransferase